MRRDDPFLIGSTTKAMTALVAARLVERGVIDWTTTLAEGMSNLVPRVGAACRDVTLEQLLAHRGGLVAFDNAADVASFASYLSNDAADLPTTLAARQHMFATWLLAQPSPDGVTPGRDFFYSNAGYALAGMMLEACTGRSFPALVDLELNQPLDVGLRLLSVDEAAKDRPSGHLFAFTNTGGEDDAWWALQRLNAALENIEQRLPGALSSGGPR